MCKLGFFVLSLIAMAYACYHKQNASNSCIEEQEKQGK
ncbi:unnamed protein product, partial [Arabidopsis halleri]